MSVVSTRTRPTRPTKPGENNQGGGGSGFPISIDWGNRDLPENLNQVGDTPFYNTPPQIETNDCGQIHPSLAYLCDIDLQDPTSFAEPSYEININGCGVCVTMTQNFSATETVAQTYCYILPACRQPEPEPEPEPLPNTSDYLIDWPAIPSLPALPLGDPNQKYRIVFEIKCRSTTHYVCGGRNFDDYFNIPCQPSEYSSNSVPATIILNTQGIGRLKQRVIRSPRSEPVYDLGAYAIAGESITVTVFYEGLVYINSSQASGEDYYIATSYSWNNAVYVREYESQEDMYYANIGGTVCTITVKEISPQPPEPPKPPKLPSPQLYMNCCADVRRLIQMVARLEKRVGVTEFPVSVPQSLLADRGNNVIRVQNIPELISWLAKQIDALVGELPGEIEVEDIDPQTEGNQTKKFKFPTLADLMLEVAGLAINNKVNTETALTAILNAMVEIGSTKATSVANYHAIQAVLDYLSPQLRQATVDLPLTFTPGETQIHKLFKPTTTKVKIVELNSKTDLQDDLGDLKKFAAEWRAQNFRKIKLDGTEAQQIKSLIKNAASLLSDEELQGNQGNDSQNQVSDFSDFLNKAERGFTDVNGITDTTNPYGRPYNQRPRIREIGDTSDRGTEET
ncbi:hypothetical protein [Microseira sp. BLCC-F43]|jgi:hypothetical protein|uniref:hypothetical protein n=1 Tax=Microseira sp. BLCC-F43 TaxID=3153602 RepID=UPI0035B885AC